MSHFQSIKLVFIRSACYHHSNICEEKHDLLTVSYHFLLFSLLLPWQPGPSGDPFQLHKNWQRPLKQLLSVRFPLSWEISGQTGNYDPEADARQGSCDISHHHTTSIKHLCWLKLTLYPLQSVNHNANAFIQFKTKFPILRNVCCGVLVPYEGKW